MPEKTYKISVKALIEAVNRSGDLGFGHLGLNRAQAGSAAHREIQDKMAEGYEKEVTVKYLVQKGRVRLEISGRIDGVFPNTNPPVVEEIKSTSQNFDYLRENRNENHWAQARCYGYIYANQKGLETLEIRLTYIQLQSLEVESFSEILSLEELSGYFFGLVDIYLDWLTNLQNWIEIRNRSIEKLEFPYAEYRSNQRQFAATVYNTIKKQTILFAQAPTGTGKTIAVLFPAVKALAQGMVEKLFFLTAKTVGRITAEKTLGDMRSAGLQIKSVTLTAKEKVCFSKSKICDPKECEYAKDYYGKLNQAFKETAHTDQFDRQTLEIIARRYKLCPFELSLDFSLICDVIICDYNYAFDPRVRLKRFFEFQPFTYAFLIDEAHNLPERARSMFSADIQKKEIIALKREIGKSLPEISNALQKLNLHLLDIRKSLLEEELSYKTDETLDEVFIKKVRIFTNKTDRWLEGNPDTPFKKNLSDFWFKCLAYIRMAELFASNYVRYDESIGKSNVITRLFCIDPAPLLDKALTQSRATVFFSATLIPLPYFKRLLVRDNPAYQTLINSPFPSENLGLYICKNISTKYIHRDASYVQIARLISGAFLSKPGNYLVYFPSYAYLNRVAETILLEKNCPPIMLQKKDMNEEEREGFLQKFESFSEPTVGFAVMGGVFGEGIDLSGEKLIGVIVVGVGLPQICLERDLIMNFFQQENNLGFQYAYLLPGLNRVLQAAGRLIRSETDKGVVLLIDERFSAFRYIRHYPEEWRNFKIVHNHGDLSTFLAHFWK